ncbi:hypothetical protein JOC95_001809 [Bacillus tianshenii]|uniref:Uncharacterized protein n=1 Tax=Sutcliffiella tianshenii TaxID=1463404 RepID=A0ABS2NZ88_9BACI|nr:hypothetical protein [Bacillus tianshenii]
MDISAKPAQLLLLQEHFEKHVLFLYWKPIGSLPPRLGYTQTLLKRQKKQDGNNSRF